MHPAYSVIFFTVSSGAGFGLLAWLGLAPLLGVAPSGALGWAGFILGFGLSVAGLLSSTQHLGHPERAWRALTQWRTSWLSREGVMAIITLVIGGLYALTCLFATPVALLGIPTTLGALATVATTAMIYQQLKTVDRWHTPWTLACYLTFAVTCGGILFVTLLAFVGSAETGWMLLLLVLVPVAWAVKLAWWRAGDAAKPLSTAETATGLGKMGSVRLLEAPHSNPNYLQKEMGYRIARKHRERLRRLALLVGGGVPLLTILVALIGVPAPVLVLGVIGLTIGLLAERWLFFAEAEHAVMTYYR